MDKPSSRPQSMEGPMDSGISLNGDTISSPDSDNSSQHLQNQSVSNPIYSLEIRQMWLIPYRKKI